MVGESDGKPQAGLGALIKQYRQDQRVTQRELAAAAGMSVGALRDLEQGRTRSPRWGTIEELVATLGIGDTRRAELNHSSRIGTARRRLAPVQRYRGTRVSILGPLVAWRDGQRLALGSSRQRAVLGLLALHANSAVHRDSMIDMLWDQRPPASAVAEVQGYVSRLRKILGEGPTDSDSPGLVTTVGGRCYQLNASLGQLDLAAFVAAIRAAREADERHDPHGACDRYEQGLRLRRGGVLADVDLLRDHPATIETTHQWAEAVLGYAGAAFRAGMHGQVLPYLRELCAAEPFNEPAHAQFMIMLAATGQQAAALQVHTDLRNRLAGELGISPSPILTQAHAQVLRQR